MVINVFKYLLDFSKSNSFLCDKYNVFIDIICGDCFEFICIICVKIDYKYYDWEIIFIVVILRKRELKIYLCKVKEKDL